MIVRSSPIEGNFFAVVKSFDANIPISGNFVLDAKNSIEQEWKKKSFLTKSLQDKRLSETRDTYAKYLD